MKKILLLTTCLLSGLVAAYNPAADIYADANKAYRASQEYAAVLQGSEKILSSLHERVYSFHSTTKSTLQETITKAAHAKRQELEALTEKIEYQKGFIAAHIAEYEKVEKLLTAQRQSKLEVLEKQREEVQIKLADSSNEYREISKNVFVLNREIDRLIRAYDAAIDYPTLTSSFDSQYRYDADVRVGGLYEKRSALIAKRKTLIDDAVGDFLQQVQETEQTILRQRQKFELTKEELGAEIGRLASQQRTLELGIQEIEDGILAPLQRLTDSLHGQITAAKSKIIISMVQGNDVGEITGPIASAIEKAFAR